MSRNVVVTGIGCVGPFGLGRQALATQSVNKNGEAALPPFSRICRANCSVKPPGPCAVATTIAVPSPRTSARPASCIAMRQAVTVYCDRSLMRRAACGDNHGEKSRPTQRPASWAAWRRW